MRLRQMSWLVGVCQAAVVFYCIVNIIHFSEKVGRWVAYTTFMEIASPCLVFVAGLRLFQSFFQPLRPRFTVPDQGLNVALFEICSIWHIICMGNIVFVALIAFAQALCGSIVRKN